MCVSFAHGQAPRNFARLMARYSEMAERLGLTAPSAFPPYRVRQYGLARYGGQVMSTVRGFRRTDSEVVPES